MGEADPVDDVSATAPSGWIATTAASQDLLLTLPAWLEVFDNSGAIFANEVLPAREQGLQLMAEGPRTASPGPQSGQDMRIWLERKVGAPGQGQPVYRPVRLAGRAALLLERIDRAETSNAWRIMAYAIETEAGIAFLMIDGPPDAWARHEDDIRLIPQLLRTGRGIQP